MARHVLCINKREHHNPHERIINIGGVDGGVRWKRSQQQAIADIEANSQAYYTSVNGKSVWVIVALHDGHKYIKTEADSTTSNNLLSLPECPA